MQFIVLTIGKCSEWANGITVIIVILCNVYTVRISDRMVGTKPQMVSTFAFSERVGLFHVIL